MLGLLVLGACSDPPPPAPRSSAPAVSTAAPAPSASASAALTGESRKRQGGPRARAGAAQITGDIVHEPVHRAVRENLGALKDCYQKGLDKNAQLKGRIIFSFTLDGGGTAKELKPDAELKDNTVIECAKTAMSSISYPKPKAGVVSVRYPILFSPGDTINDKAPKDATQADVEKALADAGATEVSAKPKDGAKGVVVFTGKAGGNAFTLTFAPASAAASFDDKAIAELEQKGFVYTDGPFLVAVESVVIAESERLLKAVVKER
jgi:hypothetical protein